MGYSISHKGYVYYDFCANQFLISRNVVFFPTQVELLPEISILPCFDDLPPHPDRFKPGLVYTRRQPSLPLLEIDLSSKTAPMTSSEIEMTFEIDPISPSMPHEPGPQRSTRVVRPLERYGDYDTSFNTTLSSISIPTCFSEAVKHECWWKAMDEEL
jgi:hypothetical protein